MFWKIIKIVRNWPPIRFVSSQSYQPKHFRVMMIHEDGNSLFCCNRKKKKIRKKKQTINRSSHLLIERIEGKWCSIIVNRDKHRLWLLPVARDAVDADVPLHRLHKCYVRCSKYFVCIYRPSSYTLAFEEYCFFCRSKQWSYRTR